MNTLVNWGVEHSMLHTNQAIRCWSKVDSLASSQQWDDQFALNQGLNKNIGKEKGKNKNKNKDHRQHQRVKEYRDVARVNMQVLRDKKMFPYSKGEIDHEAHFGGCCDVCIYSHLIYQHSL